MHGARERFLSSFFFAPIARVQGFGARLRGQGFREHGARCRRLCRSSLEVHVNFLPPALRAGSNLFSNCLDLYHTSPDVGERQYKSRTWKGLFDSTPRADGPRELPVTDDSFQRLVVQSADATRTCRARISQPQPPDLAGSTRDCWNPYSKCGVLNRNVSKHYLYQDKVIQPRVWPAQG